MTVLPPLCNPFFNLSLIHRLNASLCLMLLTLLHKNLTHPTGQIFMSLSGCFPQQGHFVRLEPKRYGFSPKFRF